MQTRSVSAVIVTAFVIALGRPGLKARPASAQPAPVRGSAISAPTSGLKWRNIGPFRGGRVGAVAGAIGQPGVFYIGLPFGGIWKTTSGGTTWFPVFDAVTEISSIASIAVAPSDPNVVYVGTGDTYAQPIAATASINPRMRARPGAI